MWMKGKMMLFAAFMCKLYDVIIIRKMSSSRKSIFYFSPGFYAQNVSTWCVWYFSVHFMFSWKLALSLSLALYFGIIPPFGRITNGQFDKINEPRRHSVFALIMPYMRYGIVVKNNEMKINFLLPFFYSSRPKLSLGVPWLLWSSYLAFSLLSLLFFKHYHADHIVYVQ